MHMAAKVVTFTMTLGSGVAGFYFGVKSGMKYAIEMEKKTSDHAVATMGELRKMLVPVYNETGLHTWLSSPNKNLQDIPPAVLVYQGSISDHHAVLKEAGRVSEGMTD